MAVTPFEFLVNSGRFENVVKRDADGNPSVFVKFPKMTSWQLSDNLPLHTHPAFIIDGVEQDYILIGKYKGAEVKVGGTIYSLPNVPPAYALSYDGALARMKAAGTGISGMTIADYGFLLLLAQKNGWTPQGNTRYAVAAQNSSIPRWNTMNGQSYRVGDIVQYGGRLYTCLTAYTGGERADGTNRPDVSPAYWEPGDMLGGIPWPGDNIIGANPDYGMYTLNGSGPVAWYLGGDISDIADIQGSVQEYVYGYRVVKCELQILPDNDAASPTADLSENSGAWKAILPGEADEYSLVEPGTPGTLHWDYQNNRLVLRAGAPGSYMGGGASRAFKDLTCDSTLAGGVPMIVRELGLFPTNGSAMPGVTGATMKGDDSEYIALCGCKYNTSASSTGLGSVRASYNRTTAATTKDKSGMSVGCRPRALA